MEVILSGKTTVARLSQPSNIESGIDVSPSERVTFSRGVFSKTPLTSVVSRLAGIVTSLIFVNPNALLPIEVRFCGSVTSESNEHL